MLECNMWEWVGMSQCQKSIECVLACSSMRKERHHSWRMQMAQAAAFKVHQRTEGRGERSQQWCAWRCHRCGSKATNNDGGVHQKNTCRSRDQWRMQGPVQGRMQGTMQGPNAGPNAMSNAGHNAGSDARQGLLTSGYILWLLGGALLRASTKTGNSRTGAL